MLRFELKPPPTPQTIENYSYNQVLYQQSFLALAIEPIPDRIPPPEWSSPSKIKLMLVTFGKS